MPEIRPRFVLILAASALVAIVLLWPSRVEAQCGTQASSCKNCHEVQAEHPVATKGDWHIDHAFGDFCEFCHAGNVTATDKDPAHEGMIYPLGDVAASCASCHPMDYEDLALQYAGVLGVDINTAVGAGETSSSEVTAEDGETAVESEPNAEQASTETSAGDAGGAVIDLNDRYTGETSGGMTIRMNVGNVILSVMLLGLIGAFGVLVWHFEGIGDKWAELRGAAPPETKAAAVSAAAPQASSALQALLPTLEKASPATLVSLSKLLETDPERGGHMIEALARIDPRLVEAVRRLDDQDLELLIALVRELKERNS